ncbi:MAG TPA: arginine deiminase family protein [Terriglobales bacterium]|nr:arginine deiminase family protein [Terriglobales bacterium]
MMRSETLMVCAPSSAGWNDDRARQWRELGFFHAPQFTEAQAQHQELCARLREFGIELVQLPASADLTLDAVYTHDASLMSDSGAILMNPGKANRVPEAKRHGSFFRDLGLSVLGEIVPPGKTEAGDMVWLDAKTLLIGQGFRTNAAGIGQMRSLLKPSGVEVICAPLPYGMGPAYCLHLMSLISPLDESTLLVDLSWLAVETVELLHSRRLRLIEIDSSERDTLACNVLTLGRNRLVALEENGKTNQKLRDAGYNVKTFPGSELCINGGGGPTCLTRPLARG